MTKVFFRYFISIFALAIIIIVIQSAVLFVQYDRSQNKWKNDVYEDFVDSVEDTVSNGKLNDYGISSLMSAVSQIDDDRVSGFILRDANGGNMLSFGKTPEGRILSMSGQRYSYSTEKKNKVKNRSAINIVTNRFGFGAYAESFQNDDVEIYLPDSLQSEDIIGSILIFVDGRQAFILDLLTYSPRTYEYSKDIINSCFRGVLFSIPVCLLFALIAAWIISSTNAKYINDVRKALKDLSKGKPNVRLPRQSNSELNEITQAIEELDTALQANSKSRKAWLGSISHDLNTPAAAMKMIIDGMKDGVFSADEAGLKQLQKENDILNQRIDRVISFSTLQADTVPVMDNVDVSDFVSDVLSDLEGKDTITVETYCQSMVCDSTLMVKAVTELLNNAITASSQAGGGPVTWTINQNDNNIQMVIKNIGYLPEGMGEEIFEPWTRGDWSRTAGGSGLGLAIASTIVYLHKGKISIEQEENTVKTVVSLPLQKL